MSAILRCWGKEQWFSIDMMIGMLEVMKALRSIASTTSCSNQINQNIYNHSVVTTLVNKLLRQIWLHSADFGQKDESLCIWTISTKDWQIQDCFQDLDSFYSGLWFALGAEAQKAACPAAIGVAKGTEKQPWHLKTTLRSSCLHSVDLLGQSLLTALRRKLQCRS